MKIEAPAAGDSFDNTPDGVSANVVRGPIIKFADRLYRKNGVPLAGEELRYTAVGIAMAWVKFVDDNPIHVFPGPNGYLPDRNTLDDLDESLWPCPFGEPADPWQNTRYLHLYDPDTAEVSTLVTASGGGRFAINQLVGQIKLKRRFSPGVFAIIELTSADWGKRFPKSRPDFRVIGWTAPTAAQPSQLPPPPDGGYLDDEPTPRATDFNDNIPY
jgi:hypothetical protein